MSDCNGAIRKMILPASKCVDHVISKLGFGGVRLIGSSPGNDWELRGNLANKFCFLSVVFIMPCIKCIENKANCNNLS